MKFMAARLALRDYALISFGNKTRRDLNLLLQINTLCRRDVNLYREVCLVDQFLWGRTDVSHLFAHTGPAHVPGRG